MSKGIATHLKLSGPGAPPSQSHPLYVRCDLLASWEASGWVEGGSYIALVNGKCFHVRESPEQIAELMRKQGEGL